MARSERERKANDAIEEALLEYRDAYAESHPEARVGTMMDWVVVAVELIPHETADPDLDESAYSIVMPNGGIPWYRARGILEAGALHLTNNF